tara:strand:+ start:93 stop:617 length:525 start_codon:yes stop_codon:yes gene_type:complete
MEDNTTRILKLANGESIVCTCIPTRTDEGSDKLHIIHPLKMELKNKITKKGIVEALTLSRWLQPFTESDELDIEKSTIITVAPASYALNNYYNFMVSTYTEAEAEMVDKDFEPSIQPRFTEDATLEEQEESTEEVKELFKKYISALTNINEEDDPIEELSEEQLDSLPCSGTKH